MISDKHLSIVKSGTSGSAETVTPATVQETPVQVRTTEALVPVEEPRRRGIGARLGSLARRSKTIPQVPTVAETPITPEVEEDELKNLSKNAFHAAASTYYVGLGERKPTNTQGVFMVSTDPFPESALGPRPGEKISTDRVGVTALEALDSDGDPSFEPTGIYVKRLDDASDQEWSYYIDLNNVLAGGFAQTVQFENGRAQIPHIAAEDELQRAIDLCIETSY